MFVDAVLVGEKISFEGSGLGVEIANRLGITGCFKKGFAGDCAQLCYGLGGVKNVEPFRDQQFQIEDIATGDSAQHFQRRSCFPESILAGLQTFSAVQRASCQEKPRLPNHAVTRQFCGHLASGSTAPELQHHRFGEPLKGLA